MDIYFDGISAIVKFSPSVKSKFRCKIDSIYVKIYVYYVLKMYKRT